MLASIDVWHHYFIRRKQTFVCMEASLTMLHSSQVVGSAIIYAQLLLLELENVASPTGNFANEVHSMEVPDSFG